MRKAYLLLPIFASLSLASCETEISSTSKPSLAPLPDSTHSSVDSVNSSDSFDSEDETPVFSTLAELKEMESGTTFTTRACWAGTNSQPYNGTYNGVFLADGDEGYLLYKVSTDLIPEDINIGDYVEVTGTINNFTPGDSDVVLPEANATSITKVDEAPGVELPNTYEVSSSSSDFETEENISRIFNFHDVTIQRTTIDSSYGNMSIDFSLNQSQYGKVYSLYLDSRYNSESVRSQFGGGGTMSFSAYLTYSNTGEYQFTYPFDITVD